MELLISAACLLQSDGRLRVSIPLVDDEGVDIVVSHRETDNTLLLQVKSRFTLNRGKNYRTQVRRVALRAGAKRFLLFVYYDTARAVLGETMWLVPSLTFEKLLSGQKHSSPIYVFQSRFTSQHDMWKPYQLSTQALASALIAHLK